jgi:hypothetical protein
LNYSLKEENLEEWQDFATICSKHVNEYVQVFLSDKKIQKNQLCCHLIPCSCRFNLLREDTEGYAKLVTCLNHFGDGSLTEETVPLLFEEIQVRGWPW